MGVEEQPQEAAYVTPGHPVKEGAGYDCACGACLAARAGVRVHYGFREHNDPNCGACITEWCDD